jgi:exodeoxyribonuclease V gamma subunit
MEHLLTSNSISPGLMLIHGNRSERLRDLLVEWMRRYPLAPLENETILVQSNGIAQWLKLALAADRDPATGSGGCGIAAALEVSLPSRFIWQAYRAVLGASAVAEVSPFDESRLVWRLMRVLPALIDRPAFEPLRRFISHDDDRRKRFQLAERIADLFDQYQMYRSDWLACWARGDDIVLDARGEPHLLPGEQCWQSDLWRALIADVAHSTDGGAAQDAMSVGLPRRIIVFGISSLPRQSLEALAALARWAQVLMCVPNPCAHYWADIVPDKELLRAQHSRQQRREGAPAELPADQLHLHVHPLLASWGKQGRDFIGLLDEFDSAEARDRYRPQFAGIGQRIDLFEERDAASLLQQLQDDIRDLRPLRETQTEWPPVDPATDNSIRFHVAHSAQREVEILHDQLLAAFNADPSLRPRDIIVMVPDIEAYAPHIQSVFGLLDREDPRYIPFSVADRGQRKADPLVGALEMLLDLPHSRVTVNDLLDLLDVPALRRRFGIDESDLPTLRAWMRGANVRWGLHAEHRASLDLPLDDHAAAPHTWMFGLRRMLLGYAVGGDAHAWRAAREADRRARHCMAHIKRAGDARRVVRTSAHAETCVLQRRGRQRCVHARAPRQHSANVVRRLRGSGSRRRAAAFRRRRLLVNPARRGRPVATLLRGRGDVRDADADARDPISPRVPARHERRRLSAHARADGFRPDARSLQARRPFAPRGRSLSAAGSGAVGARLSSRVVGRTQH